MRVAMLLAALSVAATPALAAPEQPSGPCVRASNSNQYNVHAIGRHDIWIANAVGPAQAARATTTCIHIRPDSIIGVQSRFQCVTQGDPVSVNTLGMGGERCRITRVTPFVTGSEEEGYR